MDDAVLMGVMESAAHLIGNSQSLIHGESAIGYLLDSRLDVSSRHELTDDEDLICFLAHVVDRHHMGMIAEAPHGLGLALDSLKAGFVESLRLEECNCDIAIEKCVVRQVDPFLGALTDESLDPVAAPGDG
jgi:hypothetical protein